MNKIYDVPHTLQLTEHISARFSYSVSYDIAGNVVPEVVSLKFYFTYSAGDATITNEIVGPFIPKLINEFLAAEARYIKELI